MTRAWLALPVLSLSAFGAMAADNGFYLGAGIGQAGIEAQDDVTGLELDDEDNGYKAIVGFRPLDFLAFEVNYVDLGNPEDEFQGTTFDVDAKGLDAFVVGLFPLPLVDIYGKLGFISWDTKLSAEGFGTLADDSGEDLAYGAGVQVHFGSAAVRAEYEVFEIGDLDDVNMISLGFTWTFL
jgi:Outer membrane protein beta-barrel domain